MTTWTGTVPTFTAGDTTSVPTNLNILRDIAKADAEAWTAYTPALVNLTLGDGTMVAAYSQVGKRIEVRVRIAFGSTTSIGGAVTIGMPATSVGVAQVIQCFIGAGGGTVPLWGPAYINTSAAAAQPFHPNTTTDNTQKQLGAVALTMGVNSYVMLQGTYEAA